MKLSLQVQDSVQAEAERRVEEIKRRRAEQQEKSVRESSRSLLIKRTKTGVNEMSANKLSGMKLTDESAIEGFFATLLLSLL